VIVVPGELDRWPSSAGDIVQESDPNVVVE
jgi:hypothetical protein